ncbi:MAG: metal-dependent hydrolase [Tepidisphaeraceae bacterium]
MHIQTHVLSGWCVGNLLPLTARERLMCMLAASLADLDGLGIVVSEELYWDYHHKLGHCAVFGVLLAATMAALSTHRLLSFLAYLALFHLHLVLDYFGSGPGWPIYYAWPVSDREWLNPRAWAFSSWQNIGTAFALVAWTVWIAMRRRRTPLEVLMPSLDRKAVAWIERRRGKGNRGTDEDRLPGRRPSERAAASAATAGDR